MSSLAILIFVIVVTAESNHIGINHTLIDAVLRKLLGQQMTSVEVGEELSDLFARKGIKCFNQGIPYFVVHHWALLLVQHPKEEGQFVALEVVAAPIICLLPELAVELCSLIVFAGYIEPVVQTMVQGHRQFG